MSDAAVANIVTGLVTMTTLIIGFLTLWVKVKYGVDKAAEAAAHARTKAEAISVKANTLEEKLNANNEMTHRIEEATNGPLSARLLQIDTHADKIDENSRRITALEVKVEAVRMSMESVEKNITSTRHELRGHLQTILNNQILAQKAMTPMAPVMLTTPSPSQSPTKEKTE